MSEDATRRKHYKALSKQYRKEIKSIAVAIKAMDGISVHYYPDDIASRLDSAKKKLKKALVELGNAVARTE